MRDWHAERYAAGEALAKASREAAIRLRREMIFIPARVIDVLRDLDAALAEYERTKNAP